MGARAAKGPVDEKNWSTMPIVNFLGILNHNRYIFATILYFKLQVLNITYPSRDSLLEDVSQDFTKLLEESDHV
ncbi:MAG: hypothetical protein ACUVQY_09720 [Thermoproteota archaeon]